MEELISLGRLLWDNAEPGFFEINTHKILSKKFKELGFVIQKFENIPGFIATIDGSYETKPIVLISDMDALPLPGDPELLNKIIFIAIPAEEYIDFDKREKLIKDERISLMSGKLELIKRNSG